MKAGNRTEIPGQFECDGDRLFGIVAQPDFPSATGVVIVVGGPQYRAGSHRQFTLLARDLADRGIASIRFDYRGMGDSEGDARDFLGIDRDIDAAMTHLQSQVPQVREFVLWGLCDAASASLLHAHSDPRVSGLVLLNPWTESESADAQARVRFYYPARLVSPAFWKKLFTFGINPFKAVVELVRNIGRSAAQGSQDNGGFTGKMRDALERFEGDTLIILSGNDHTAQRFTRLCSTDPRWQAATGRASIQIERLPGADHTFSTRAWRDQVSRWTSDWLHEIVDRAPRSRA